MAGHPLGALLGLSLACTAAPAPSTPDCLLPNWAPVDGPLNIAHRAGAGVGPEESILAARRSLAAGAEVIEVDARPTADGEMVLVHDATVDRTHLGTGAVADLRLEELQRLAPRRDAAQPEAGIATLGQMLRAFPDQRFVVELKSEDPAHAHQLLDAIPSSVHPQDLALTSVDDAPMAVFRDSAHPTALTLSETVGWLLLGHMDETAQKARFGMWPVGLIHVGLLDAEALAEARAACLSVQLWTVNEAEDIAAARALGVDGIMGDHPSRLTLP